MKTLAILAAVSLTACAGSKEEQLVDARREQRKLVDDLYAEYGGGKLAAELQKETRRGAAEERDPAAIEIIQMIGNAAGEVDRAAFEAQCLGLGEGQRPLIMNDKAKAFFSSASTERQCVRAAQLQRKVDALERELGVAPPATR